jgi:hypothetical protein
VVQSRSRSAGIGDDAERSTREKVNAHHGVPVGRVVTPPTRDDVWSYLE